MVFLWSRHLVQTNIHIMDFLYHGQFPCSFQDLNSIHAKLYVYHNSSCLYIWTSYGLLYLCIWTSYGLVTVHREASCQSCSENFLHDFLTDTHSMCAFFPLFVSRYQVTSYSLQHGSQLPSFWSSPSPPPLLSIVAGTRLVFKVMLSELPMSFTNLEFWAVCLHERTF